MAAQRQLQPEPARPALRLLTSAPDEAAAADVLAAADAAFGAGLRWGILLSSLGFWLPVATALCIWLTQAAG